MKKIVIIGASGFATEVAWLIEEINAYKLEWEILGFVDDNFQKLPEYINGYKVLGDTNYINQLSDEVFLIVGIGNGKIREKIVKKVFTKLSGILNSGYFEIWFQRATLKEELLDIEKYKEIYDKVLKDKKKLVLVTIGSVDRSKYAGGVTNAGIEKFNEQMLEYADKNNIQVIDAYSYLQSNGFETWDGLHYKGDTNTGLYEFILSELNSIG